MDIILKGTKEDIETARKRIERKNRTIDALAGVYSLVSDACVTYLCEEGAGQIARRSKKHPLAQLAMRAGGALLGMSLSAIGADQMLAELEGMKTRVVGTIEIKEEESNG